MSDNLALYILTGLFVLSQFVHGHIVALHVRIHEKQMEYLRQRIAAQEALAAIQQDFPEEHAGLDGWTDWIHPLPGYRMQCCDCGLVHRLELRVDDLGQPNFRMAREPLPAPPTSAADGRMRDE